MRVAFGLSLTLLLLAAWDAPPARTAEGLFYQDYVVAADNPQASQAGASILAQGGNAADAAAATMLALGVVSPTGSGLGGGGFALYYRAKDKSLTFLDFREVAPAAATPDMFAVRDEKPGAPQKSRVGGLAVGVPGEPAGIVELVTRFGSQPLSKIAEPAYKLASEGFDLTAHTLRVIGMVGPEFLSDPLASAIFGKAPTAGARAKNTALAGTIKRFGEVGKSLFYTGALTGPIVRAVKQSGGVMTAADLAGYRVVERAPLRGDALGYQWVTAPLPSAGGTTILTSMGLLERWLPTPEHWKGAPRFHALIESWKGPFLDRQFYLGDPDKVSVPLAELNDPARQAARAARFHPGLALPADTYALPLAQRTVPTTQADNRGTSHLCVVDAEGNIAAVTTTVNLAFGSRIGVAGLWLNDEMDDFAREVGKHNAFGLVGGANNLPAPGKRPISSMSPTIVFKDGAPVLCVGGSGGSRIVTAVEQVALYVLHDGMHPAQAVTAPRLHHQAEPEQVDARDLPPDVTAELVARGHTVKATQWAAHVQAVRIGPPGAEHLAAASDPQKGGLPAGK